MNKKALPWIYASIGAVIGIIFLMIFIEKVLFLPLYGFFTTMVAGCISGRTFGLKGNKEIGLIVGGVLGFLSFSRWSFLFLLCVFILIILPLLICKVELEGGDKSEKLMGILFFVILGLLVGCSFLPKSDALCSVSCLLGLAYMYVFFIMVVVDDEKAPDIPLVALIIPSIICILVGCSFLSTGNVWGWGLIVTGLIPFVNLLGASISIYYLYVGYEIGDRLLTPIILFSYIGYKIGVIVKEREEERGKRLQILMEIRNEIASRISEEIPLAFKSEAKRIQKEIDTLCSKKYIPQFKIDKIKSSVHLLEGKLDQFYAKISDIEKEIKEVISLDPANLSVKANQIMKKIRDISGDKIIQREQEIKKEINSVRKELIEKEKMLKKLTRQSENNIDELNKVDSYLKLLEKEDPANVGIKIKKVNQEWKNFSQSEIQSLKVHGEIEEMLKRKYLLNFSIQKVAKEIEHLNQEISRLHNEENQLKIEKLLIQRERLSRNFNFNSLSSFG